jgi:hypothetical protein
MNSQVRAAIDRGASESVVYSIVTEIRRKLNPHTADQAVLRRYIELIQISVPSCPQALAGLMMLR